MPVEFEDEANYFVFYEDSYADDGEFGLKGFADLDRAIEFIEARLVARGTEQNLNDYILIKGQKMLLEKREIITKIEVI